MMMPPQKPPRGSRVNKTSQGTRARNNTKPLLPPQISAYQEHTGEDGMTYVQQQSDPRARYFNLAQKQLMADSAYSQPATQQFGSNQFPFRQRSTNNSNNGMFSEVSRKTKRASKQRSYSGQVTLFHQIKNQSAYAQKNNENWGSELMARERSQRKLRRSTISNRSKSSSKSGGRGTPNSKKGRRRSLNFGKRAREQNTISVENMRMVTKLVNVKPTVPQKIEINEREKSYKKLKKNMATSFVKVNHFPVAGSNQANTMIEGGAGSSKGSQRGSRMGTPKSQRSERRKQMTPKADHRFKAKGMQNFHKIQSASADRHSNNTPDMMRDYLKPRKLNSKDLAKMYEADDHLLFGTKKKRRGSDTASRTSSQRSSLQGSARRKFRSKRRRVLGETGSDSAFQQNDYFESKHKRRVVQNAHSAVIHPKSNSTIQYLLEAEPIAEHPGPKPNPGGHSLISKMNHLMSQKLDKSRRIGDSKNVIAEQVERMITADQESYITAGKSDLHALHMRQEPDNGNKRHGKKSATAKPGKSLQRQHGKRKSLQDAFSSHPLAAVQVTNPKTALLSGYYRTAEQHLASAKPKKQPQNRNQAAGSLPPRAVKTATIRKSSAVEPVLLDYISSKVSPNSKVGSVYAASQHARTTQNAASTYAGGRRRIIVATNKQQNQNAHQTDSGWNRRKGNMTAQEDPEGVQARPRPEMPLSAHPATKAQKQYPPRPPRQAPQPLGAYQDGRKKFLTNKLFSPVLGSQHASQTRGAFEQPPTNEPSTQYEDDLSEAKMPDIAPPDGLRPRVTRTAEGSKRPRMRVPSNSSKGDVTDTYDYARDGSDLLPAISSLKEENQIVPKQWLVQNSSVDDKSQLAEISHSVAQIQTESLQKIGGKEENMTSGSKSGTRLQDRGQLNVESQDTFNVLSGHNIINQINEEHEGGDDGLSESGSYQDPLAGNEKFDSSNMMKFNPESEAQVKEDSEESQTDKEDVGNDATVAVLPKSYPRLI